METQTSLLEWMGSHEELSIVFMALVTGVVITIISVVAYYIRAIRLGEKQLELKQTMVEQGMSVEEMQKVLRV